MNAQRQARPATRKITFYALMVGATLYQFGRVLLGFGTSFSTWSACAYWSGSALFFDYICCERLK